MKSVYICSECGARYETAEEAEKCEKSHSTQIEGARFNIDYVIWKYMPKNKALYLKHEVPAEIIVRAELDGRDEPVSLVYHLDYESRGNALAVRKVSKWAEERGRK